MASFRGNATTPPPSAPAQILVPYSARQRAGGLTSASGSRLTTGTGSMKKETEPGSSHRAVDALGQRMARLGGTTPGSPSERGRERVTFAGFGPPSGTSSAYTSAQSSARTSRDATPRTSANGGVGQLGGASARRVVGTPGSVTGLGFLGGVNGGVKSMTGSPGSPPVGVTRMVTKAGQPRKMPAVLAQRAQERGQAYSAQEATQMGMGVGGGSALSARGLASRGADRYVSTSPYASGSGRR